MITMMTIKDDDKGYEQKAQRINNNSSESRTSQEFKNQRIKTQDLKNQDQDSRIKIQE